MATKLWGSLVGRRGSSAEPLDLDEIDQDNHAAPPRRSASSHVQTLGTMRSKSSISSTASSSTAAAAVAGSSDGSQNNSPGQREGRPPSRQSDKNSTKAAVASSNNGSSTNSPFSDAAAGAAAVNGNASDGGDPAHDSASSACGDGGSDSAGHLSRRSSNSSKPASAAAAPAGPTAAPQQEPPPTSSTAVEAALAVLDADRTLSLSLGFSPEHAPGSHAAPAAGMTSQPQQQHSNMSFATTSTQSMQHLAAAGGFLGNGIAGSGSAQQHSPGSATPGDGSTPRLSSPSGFGMGLFSSPLVAEPMGGLGVGGAAGLGAGLGWGASASQLGGGAGGAGPSLEALIAELQATAGLSPEQAAAAAAVMMPRMTTPASPLAQHSLPNPFQAPTPTGHNPWAHSPPQGSGQGFAMGPLLSPRSPLGLNPSSTPDLGAAGYLAMSTQPELLGSPVAALGGAGTFAGGPLMGFDSVHSSSSNNLVSGGAYAMGGPAAAAAAAAGGLLSPESSYLAEYTAAQYAHDGLDIPGTAQIAVHNVPFKWCNDDLEELFREQEGYLDAQLLFHENGRSKGVGVGLFRDRGCAVEACNKLSGAQADGRKLELVLMNSDNHVSFSCRQVAVLGLPWEYTSADVCALLEAAAEADGTAPADAGVEHVEVAYRDDGKSEGRAIATFASRRQAHDAIRRLHGKETLAGLRMRLFYLHEPQQTRNQNVLAQLRTQQLLPSLIPGMAGLAFADHSLSPSGGQSNTGLVSTPVSTTEQPSQQQQGTFGRAGGSGDVVSAGDGSSGQNAQGAKKGEGAGGEGAAAGVQGEERPAGGDVTPGSGRSSLDKDQGPVILHVSGLMESVTREQLRELFSQAGEVTKVDIPDGGRSMGYGFITFSNPQAAEQAMLLFNNYPLGGGAIHVAYSTSATAKARQQALRQARKATLGTSRASTDGDPGRQPGTPRGMGPAGRRGPGMSPFPSNPSLGALGGGLPGALDGLGHARHSFELPGMQGGYGGSYGGGGMWPHGPGGGMGGMGGMSSSLGALAGTPPGMHAAAAAAMAQGRARRNSFEYGAGPQLGGPSALQMLQGTGLGAGLDVSTAGNLDQQLQLLMQMTGTAGEPGAFGPGAGGMLGVPGMQPATPPGALRPSPLVRGPTGGLFSPPMSASSGFSGMAPGAGGLPGLSTPPGPYQLGVAPGGFFGGNAAASAAPGLGGLMSPAGMTGVTGPAPGLADGSHVLVTGLPPGLSDADLRALFEICGALRSVDKQEEQDRAVVTYESVDNARKAIAVLNGTRLPSGTILALQLLPDHRPGTTHDTASWQHLSPAMAPDTPGMFGIGSGGGGVGGGAAGRHSPLLTGLATPPRGSFAGEGGAGVMGSGSLFPVAEAGNTGELFGGAFGSNMGGLSHLGGFGSVGSGLRVGATSPAFGRPPRDGSGPATAAASALYSTTPMRAGSPAAAAGRVGSGAQAQGPGLPPMYSGGLGMTGSGSAGTLFGRSPSPEGGLGVVSRGSAVSEAGSAHGSDGGRA